MLKYYDVKCEKCGMVQEQLVEGDNDFDPCEECGGRVKRVFTTFNYKLLYDNKKDVCGWSFNNYERSRYWDDVKKEKERGKDVKPFHEK